MDKITQMHARKNRKNLTVPERKIRYEILARKQTGYKFLRQHPIGHFITDFYCRELKLIIEIDGVKEFIFCEISKATPSIPLRFGVPTFGEKGGGSTSFNFRFLQ